MNAIVTFLDNLFSGEGTPYLVIGAILIAVFVGNLLRKLALAVWHRARHRF